MVLGVNTPFISISLVEAVVRISATAFIFWTRRLLNEEWYEAEENGPKLDSLISIISVVPLDSYRNPLKTKRVVSI